MRLSGTQRPLRLSRTPPSGAGRRWCLQTQPADRKIDSRRHRWVLQHLFDLFLRDIMLSTMLHVAIRVVVHVPDDCVVQHCSGSASLWYYNTTPIQKVNRKIGNRARRLAAGPDRRRLRPVASEAGCVSPRATTEKQAKGRPNRAAFFVVPAMNYEVRSRERRRTRARRSSELACEKGVPETGWFNCIPLGGTLVDGRIIAEFPILTFLLVRNLGSAAHNSLEASVVRHRYRVGLREDCVEPRHGGDLEPERPTMNMKRNAE